MKGFLHEETRNQNWQWLNKCYKSNASDFSFYFDNFNVTNNLIFLWFILTAYILFIQQNRTYAPNKEKLLLALLLKASVIIITIIQLYYCHHYHHYYYHHHC